MPVERLRMRPWLEGIINSQKYTGVVWVDEEKKMFRLPWKHASRNGWKINTDACLFRAWAEHTGKFKEKETPNPKIWKANFRCALNSLPDMEEVAERRSTKGNDAFKVYKIIDRTNSQSKKSSLRKHKGRYQRKKRSLSRTNSERKSQQKIKDDTQFTEEGEPLEVGLEFTVPAQEIFGQHLVDHDYTQTRYFDIYEENGRDLCEALHVPESKVVKTEPRYPGAKDTEECSLYDENDRNSRKCQTRDPSFEADDKVLSDDEVIELIEELSSECDSNLSSDAPMEEFSDGCMESLPEDSKKERANSAPIFDSDFDNLTTFQPTGIVKSKSVPDLQSIMSTSAQEFLQSCLS